MINQQELSGYINQSIPELAGMCTSAQALEPNEIARQMINYASSHEKVNDLNAAKNCFMLAEHLYSNGDKAIKNAIENVFVYSLSHKFFYDETRRNNVMRILPNSLYEMYKKQVISSHI